jgi:phospholipase C
MATYSDYDWNLDGQYVDYWRRDSNSSASMVKGGQVSATFYAVRGTITVSAGAWPLQPETPPRQPHPPRDNDFHEQFHHVAARVELFAPGATSPVAHWDTETGWLPDEEQVFTHGVGGQGSPPGQWTVRITNRSGATARVGVGVRAVYCRMPLLHKSLSRDLLDKVYGLILQALMVSVRFSGSNLEVNFGEELRSYFGGANAPDVLGTTEIALPSGLTGTGELQFFTLNTCTPADVQSAIAADYQSKLHDAQISYDRQVAIANAQNYPSVPDHDAALAELESLFNLTKQGLFAGYQARLAPIRPEDPCIHAKVQFSNVRLDYERDISLGALWVGTISLDAAEIEQLTADLYLTFDPDLAAVTVNAFSPATFTGGLADIAMDLGLIHNAGVFVTDNIPGPIQAAGRYIGRYLREATVQLVGGASSVFFGLRDDAAGWAVSYTAAPYPHLPPPTGGVVIPGHGGVVIGHEPADGRLAGEEPPDQLGEFPAEFSVNAPETLARLDNIETIVVVMMENRSFEHLLGALGAEHPNNPAYKDFSKDIANLVTGQSAAHKHPASEVVEHPVTQITVCPDHSSEGTNAQINDGRMDGFAQCYLERSPAPGQVLSYYTRNELPVYYALADVSCVCDHWFAAHPGPTWPNRWCTLTGRTPELNNPDITEPDLGFLKLPTIFDLLTATGIGWRLFESDLSLLRTFDNYRLDTEHLVPFDTLSAHAGNLPPVVFIEPNFSDVPPLSTACDDLAPVDLRKGQNFINSVVTMLQAGGQWDNTLLIITYDEHGGFFDHMPPPGTPLGPPEWIGKIPKVHPDGKDHLGVRVPAILVSPWVAPGGVCSTVFDHTSIIKTILLRHRNTLRKSQFTMFGDRVNAANHLGMALAASPGSARYAPVTVPRASAVPTAPGPDDDFYPSLRKAFLPKAVG